MIEKEFDKMLEDLDSANDEFVNDYFNSMDDLVFEKEPKEGILESEDNIIQEPENNETEEKMELENNETEDKITSENNNQEYQNRFTSFSKTNINKLGSKKIKVYHQNNYEQKEDLQPEPEKKKPFSYNEILDRLDQEKKYDLNNISDLMKFIDKCNTADEFFNYVESETNDK